MDCILGEKESMLRCGHCGKPSEPIKDWYQNKLVKKGAPGFSCSEEGVVSAVNAMWGFGELG